MGGRGGTRLRGRHLNTRRQLGELTPVTAGGRRPAGQHGHRDHHNSPHHCPYPGYHRPLLRPADHRHCCRIRRRHL
ncbi:hypothetical protein ACFFX0_13930 [Citricoccus parietis]|uniref:Uncharacterized protein n=1 Tax=Citricoccus parietis TaxID=592307 RepID=A0ABV5FZX8_9MICC